MINITFDSSGADNTLQEKLDNVNKLYYFLANQGKDILRDSNKRSFLQQRAPDGTPWTKSWLSQHDSTGSPRKTLIRSTALFQDTQEQGNYLPIRGGGVNGPSLEEFTSVQGLDGEFYGAKHNAGRWEFAGLDLEAMTKLKLEMANFIMDNK